MSEAATISTTSGGRTGSLGRLAATTLLVWPALGLYFIIALGPSAPPATVEMPGWVPFWPAFAPVYVSLLLVPWLLPLAVRDTGRFVACLTAIAIAYLLVAPWWVIVPTRLDRPPMPEGWWAEPYRWIATVDPPRCVLPCGHGLGPTVAAWFVAFDRPAWRKPLAVMLLLGLPSIALIGQHRPIDILIGEAAAAVGIVVGEVMHRRIRARRIGSVQRAVERP